MDFKDEIILIIIGSGIGFLISILTSFINEWMKRKGKVRIYTKKVYSSIGKNNPWGFYDNGGLNVFFKVPLWVEIQNTSKTARVIRDLNILLYKDDKYVSVMKQMNKYRGDDEGIQPFANDGSYSFVAEPISIKRYDCYFVIYKNQLKESKQFNEIKVRYFDEKDKEHIFQLCKVSDCWKLGTREADTDWLMLHK